MTRGTWFGRDPATLTAQIVSGVIALVVLIPMEVGLSAAIAGVASFAGGIVVAFVVRKDGQLAAILAFGKAGIVLIVVLGVDWSPAFQALLLVAVEQWAGIFIRDRVKAPVDEDGVPVADRPFVGGPSRTR